MKKASKIFAVLAASILTFGAVGAMSSCAVTEFIDNITPTQTQKEENVVDPNAPTSELFGTFTHENTYGQKAGECQTTPDRTKTKDGNVEFVYVGKFPIENAGQPISYKIEQNLKLNRDFSYRYQYSITLKNPQDWGGEVALVEFDLYGTFTFTNAGANTYNVVLADPTAGTETIYSCNVSNPGSVYNWNKHGTADAIIDIAKEKEYNPSYELNKYMKGRTFTVTKTADDKSVSENEFYRDIIIDVFTPYMTY